MSEKICNLVKSGSGNVGIFKGNKSGTTDVSGNITVNLSSDYIILGGIEKSTNGRCLPYYSQSAQSWRISVIDTQPSAVIPFASTNVNIDYYYIKA